MAGFVYVISNPILDRVKIGKSIEDPSEGLIHRLNQEYGSAEDFKCEYYAYVSDEDKLEMLIHAMFKARRPDPQRDFFSVSINEAIDAIRDLASQVGGIKYEEVFHREIHTVTYEDGSEYEGEMLDGHRHGEGTLSHAIFYDTKQLGFFPKSSFHSLLVSVPDNFDFTETDVIRLVHFKYVGQWRHDLREGYGVEYRNWKVYQGGWKNNKRHGFGTSYNSKKGSVEYEGNWLEGERHGEGTYKTSNASGHNTEYSGGWKNGEEFGRGARKDWKDGRITLEETGHYADGKMNGIGLRKIYLGDGSIEEYEGTFLDDEFHGKNTAKHLAPDGTKTEIELNWDHGYPSSRELIVARVLTEHHGGNTTEYEGGWSFPFSTSSNLTPRRWGYRYGNGVEIFKRPDGYVRRREGNWTGNVLDGFGSEVEQIGENVISRYSGEWKFGTKVDEVSESFPPVKQPPPNTFLGAVKNLVRQRFGSKENRIISSLLSTSARLTDLSIRERPNADRASVEVVATIALLIITVSVLSKEKNDPLIDILVERLSRAVPDRSVNLHSALPRQEDRNVASAYLQGAYATNVLGAFEAIYNTRLVEDLSLINEADNGPMGRLGGMATVLARYLFEPNSTPPMIDLIYEVTVFLNEIVFTTPK